MNTEAANAAIAAKDKAQYDTSAKRLLAQKSILAHILVHTIDQRAAVRQFAGEVKACYTRRRI